MKYSLSSNWISDLEKDGILYFAQRLEEMLFDYSIDLYRMPLLNTHGLAKNYCNVAERVKLGEIKEYQREIVFDELLTSMKKDIVLKEYWGLENINKITKVFGSSSQQEKYNSISYLDSMLSNYRYYDWCTKALIKYTNQPKQKKKIDEILRIFLPELIDKRYDPHYIYSELKKGFFQKSNVDQNSVETFLKAFDFNKHNYTVYFSVSALALKFKDILGKRLSVCFNDDGNFQYFNKQSNKIIVYFKDVKALCPNTAAQMAYDRLDLFFSFYKFVGNKRSFSVEKKAMVIENEKTPVFVDAQNLNYNIIDEINFDQIGITSDNLLTGLLINAESEYSLLSKSIELHNTALAIPDMKSGFLNLWASIEILCQNKNTNSKLEAVLKIIIPILKKDYINSIVNNIAECLKENTSEQKYVEILEQVAEVGCENKKMFYMLLLPKYDTLRKNVMEELKNYPVIRSRISLLGSLETTKGLRILIEDYIQRVTYHLYRMYLTRNAIIHSGNVPPNIKYLGEHLHSYADAIITEYVVKLSGDVPFKSVEDVSVDIKFAIENLENTIAKNITIDEKVVNVLIHPEIETVMHCEEHIKTSGVE